MEPDEQTRKTRMMVFAILIASFLVLGSVGFVLGNIGRGDEAGSSNASRTDDEECAADTSRHPRTGDCIPNTDVCNAWMDGTASQTVRCNAQSRDGRALLLITLQGSGSALVRVLDPASSRHEQRYVFSDTRELELEGTTGAWALEVTFEDAAGSARIELWG